MKKPVRTCMYYNQYFPHCFLGECHRSPDFSCFVIENGTIPPSLSSSGISRVALHVRNKTK